MTRALILSHTAEKGGAELFLIDLIRHGDSAWRAGFLKEGPAAEQLRRDGFEPLVLPADAGLLSVRRGTGAFAALGAIRGMIATGRRLARAARDFDVLCANSQKALFVSAIASKLSGKPLIWVLHDIITDPAFSALNRRAAVTVANRFAARVMVNSRQTAAAFVEAGGRADLVVEVPNGFVIADHPVATAEAGAALRTELGLDKRPIVGLFGRLAPWKGQHVLIDALARLPDVQAILVGAALFGHDGYEAELRARADAAGVADRIRFLGFRGDVPRLMAAVDMVAHTSISPEPFGRVVVEAMLAQRPVIATREGGVVDIVRDGETGLLVPPGDVDALIDAIRSVCDNPDRSRGMAERARSDAVARFDIAGTCRAIEGVFDAVSSARR